MATVTDQVSAALAELVSRLDELANGLGYVVTPGGDTVYISPGLRKAPRIVVAELQAEIDRTIDLAAGLPEHQKEARILLETVRRAIGISHLSPCYGKPKQYDTLVVGQHIKRHLGEVLTKYKTRLDELSIELKVWLPETHSKDGNAVEVKSPNLKAKRRTPPSPFEKIRHQRNEFSCQRRKEKPPQTWPEIFEEYSEKYPDDKKASSATLRLSHDRNCLKCFPKSDC